MRFRPAPWSFLNKPDRFRWSSKARLRNIVRYRSCSVSSRTLPDWLRQEVDKATADPARTVEEEIILRLSRAAGYKIRKPRTHHPHGALLPPSSARRSASKPNSAVRSSSPPRCMTSARSAFRDQVLLKPGKLDPDDRTHMQEHTAIGAAILAIEEPAPQALLRDRGVAITSAGTAPAIRAALPAKPSRSSGASPPWRMSSTR